MRILHLIMLNFSHLRLSDMGVAEATLLLLTNIIPCLRYAKCASTLMSCT